MNYYLIIVLISDYMNLIDKIGLRLLSKKYNNIFDSEDIWNDILFEKYKTRLTNSKHLLRVISESSYPITQRKIKQLETHFYPKVSYDERYDYIGDSTFKISNIDILIKFKASGPHYGRDKYELVYITKNKRIVSYIITEKLEFDGGLYVHTIQTIRIYSFDYNFSYYKNVDYDTKFTYFNKEEWIFGMNQIKFEFDYPKKRRKILEILKTGFQYAHYSTRMYIGISKETKKSLFEETFKIASSYFNNIGSIIIQLKNKYLHFCKLDHGIEYINGRYSFIYEFDSIEDLLKNVIKLNSAAVAQTLLI